MLKRYLETDLRTSSIIQCSGVCLNMTMFIFSLHNTELENTSLWHIDPLLGNDHEISNHTMTVTRQWPVNSNRGKVFLCGPCRDVISRPS
jgi:hypothetical protein